MPPGTKGMKSYRKCAGILAVLCVAIAPRPEAFAESVLTPQTALHAWGKAPQSRTPAEQLRIRLHGIRNTPLDPNVWATLRKERTHNVRIIPIKRFFLRRSEAPDFRVKTMRVSFTFERASKKLIDSAPHDHDPVLEIGFGGKEAGANDEGYALRVSAAPEITSGIYYHLNGEYHLLAKAKPDRVGAYVAYSLELEISPNEARVRLDGAPFASVTGRRLDEGFISLAASWHPIYITSLDIAGRRSSETDQEIHESGLVLGTELTR